MLAHVDRDLRLPDGRLARIRAAVPNDAAAMVTLMRAQAEDGRGMVISADQVGESAKFRARIEEQEERRARGELAISWVAELAGELVAEGHVAELAPALCRHVADLSLGVHPHAQRLGLGRALLTTLVDAARRAGILRLELRVRADNDRARALYSSVGFVDECVRRRFVRLADGTFVDDLVMVRFFEPTFATLPRSGSAP
jgi:putative acetyltransferase